MNSVIRLFEYNQDNPLYFTKIYFWIFFFVVLLIYSILYKRKATRNAYLFLISLFFYYKSGGIFFLLLIFSTLSDYTLGHLIYQAKRKMLKKTYVALSVMINLLLLSYFKYAEFFTNLVNDIFHTRFETVDIFASWSNQFLGTHFNVSEIILPVGISFFTFQTISYTVDIYRNKVKPISNIFDFGFYVSFFPQLVAGPIVRASEFVPQLYNDYRLSKSELGHALFLILAGLFKKMIISDYISINFVDRVFQSPLTYSGFENLMALYGYSLQIYCDFSGYTDIAIGVAMTLGFRLPLNFNSPYKAVNLTDFWRRWHISLSKWLRDYLYIPLGGNRKGKLRRHINIFVTMVLGGLWHGAKWHFVIWGAIHGAGLIIQKLMTSMIPTKLQQNHVYRFLSIFITFHVVTFGWAFFRAKNFDEAITMLSQIIYQFNFSNILNVLAGYGNITILLVIGFVSHWTPYTWQEKFRGFFIHTPLWVKGLIIILFFILIYQFQSTELQPFIYFQF